MIESNESVRGGRGGRVLLLAPQPFYEDRGTPIAVRQVLRALSELGYRTDVVTYPIGESPEIPGVEYFRVANPLKFENVAIGFSARKILLDLLMVPLARGLLRRHRYEMIHAVEEAAFLAVLLARRHRVPVLYDMQSSLPEQMEKYPAFGNRPAQRLLQNAEAWLLSKVDRVVSSAGLGERVRAIAPGTPVREWKFHALDASNSPTNSPDPAELRERLGIAADAPVVLYSGNFAPYQGTRLLLEAMSAVLEGHPEAVLVLVGVDGSRDHELSRGAEELVESGKLHLVARQPREHVPAFLALANVLVSPRTDGANLPLKIFDYLQARRPIVATNVPAHRGVLNDNLAVLVEPTAAGLAAGIVEVLADSSRADRLCDAAAGYADEHLGWARFIQFVRELHDRTAGTAPSPDYRSEPVIIPEQ